MTDEQIAATLAEHENRIKVSEHRIKDVEESQKEIKTLTIAVHKMAISLEQMVSEQKSLIERVNVIERKPAKKWESLGDMVLTAIVSTLIGALAAGAIGLMAFSIYGG